MSDDLRAALLAKGFAWGVLVANVIWAAITVCGHVWGWF